MINKVLRVRDGCLVRSSIQIDMDCDYGSESKHGGDLGASILVLDSVWTASTIANLNGYLSGPPASQHFET